MHAFHFKHILHMLKDGLFVPVTLKHLLIAVEFES